jgi:hypothetical protein
MMKKLLLFLLLSIPCLAQTNVVYDSNFNVIPNSLELNEYFPALGATTSLAYGLINQTAATSGTAAQVSPALWWEAQGWKSNFGGSQSQAGIFRAWVNDGFGAAATNPVWTLDSSVNGGSFGNAMTFDSQGNLQVTGLSVTGSNAVRFPGVVVSQYNNFLINDQGGQTTGMYIIPTNNTNENQLTIDLNNANETFKIYGNSKIDQDVSTGGSPSFSAITSLSTALSVGNGGMGGTTHTAHGVLLGEGSSAVAASSAGTLGYPFLSGGSSADGAYGQLNLAGSGVTGILPYGNLGLTFNDSLSSSGGTVTLLNDAASGTSEYYGFNAASALGFHALPTVPVGANPTATIGLTASNGTASTFMRSDAAPALGQGISPTWTQPHKFSINNSSATPNQVILVNTATSSPSIIPSSPALTLEHSFYNGSSPTPSWMRLYLQSSGSYDALNIDFSQDSGSTWTNVFQLPLSTSVGISLPTLLTANGFTDTANGGTSNMFFQSGGLELNGMSGNSQTYILYDDTYNIASDAHISFRTIEDSDETASIGLPRVAAANFSVSSSTSLAIVTNLSINANAGQSYTFHACFNVSPDVVGGEKYAIGGTATATSVIYEIHAINNSTSANSITSKQTSLGGSAGASGATDSYVQIDGSIVVNAAGTLGVEFAQNTASGTSTVLAGSSFSVSTY